MVTTFYPPYAFGGDANYVHRLANLLATCGHTVDIIHCLDSYRALSQGAPLAGYDDAPGITVHGLESSVSILSPLATHLFGHPLFKTRKIRAILDANQFDVIHFHNISLIGGPGILRFGKGIKLYTIHEHWLVCPTHVLFKFNKEACEEKACLRCQLVHRKPPQLWRYTNALEKALHHVDAFVAPSQFTLTRHRKEGLEIPIVNIPHCAGECAGTSPAPNGHDPQGLPGRPFFLFVGRLEKLKGLHTVIPLFQHNPLTDLVVAGAGCYGDALRKLAAGSPHIHFLGQLTPAQLSEVYKRSIALLVPSVTFEVFAHVIIEAFAARTPVIVRDLGSLPELVWESGGGFVYRDNEELLRAMTRLRDDPTLRNKLGEAGYQAYRSQWTEAVHLQRYFSLIEEIRTRKRVAAVQAAP